MCAQHPSQCHTLNCIQDDCAFVCAHANNLRTRKTAINDIKCIIDADKSFSGVVWSEEPQVRLFCVETEVHLHKALMRAKVPRVTLN